MGKLTLILDAMGVIYSAGDDVGELLVPFIHERGGLADGDAVVGHYIRASRGETDAAAFWRAVGLAPDLEDEYLSLHRLSAGVLDLLDNLPAFVNAAWCLSNDLSQWSRKLRTLHQLEHRFAGFVISADVGARKPEREIYEHLLAAVGRPPETLLFVDDQTRNLDAARNLGLETLLFDPHEAFDDAQQHRCVRSFAELAEYLQCLCTPGLRRYD